MQEKAKKVITTVDYRRMSGRSVDDERVARQNNTVQIVRSTAPVVHIH